MQNFDAIALLNAKFENTKMHKLVRMRRTGDARKDVHRHTETCFKGYDLV
jgi:hypothetical protein